MCIADRSRARAKLCLPRAAIEFEPTAPGAAQVLGHLSVQKLTPDRDIPASDKLSSWLLPLRLQLASMAVVTLSTVITGAFW
jgi:hypothetical protein